MVAKVHAAEEVRILPTLKQFSTGEIRQIHFTLGAV